MSKKVQEVAVQIAMELIAAVQLGVAVSSTDLQAAVAATDKSADYTQAQLEQHVRKEIKRNWRPGISKR